MTEGRDSNPYLDFYGKHSISPVHQDLSDFQIHLTRRSNLYRLLGLPAFLFQNQIILEVGPGGGYNSLTLFAWGANVDFVEPNPTAQQELTELLNKYQIVPERWSLYPGLIEDYPGSKVYNLVLAEGFIPGLFEREKVVAKLKSLVKPGGVVVVTCFDEISFFFEILKRLVAHYLTMGIDDFNQKVEILIKAFETHLKTLKYVSRPIEDWVKDMLLNPAVQGRFFSIVDCVKEFGDDFQFLGSSPSMFINYQWYKNVDFDLKQSIIEQYQIKKHNLLLWDLDETTRPITQNEKLSELAGRIRDNAKIIESIRDRESTRPITNEIILLLREINDLVGDLDRRINLAINEVITLLIDEKIDAQKVANSFYFAQTFGRGQQYVSLQKRNI
jgi:hypothetical protein